MTLKKRDLTPNMVRWVLLLDQYDYVIKHRSGSQMRHTDALSRNCYDAGMVVTLHDQMQQAQDCDDGFKAIKEICGKDLLKIIIWKEAYFTKA